MTTNEVIAARAAQIADEGGADLSTALERALWEADRNLIEKPKPPKPTRYAVVRADAGQADQIRAYLPDNYELVGRTPMRATNTVEHLLVGRDVAGWTLDGYVIPRLQSGLYYVEEIS